MIVKHKQQRKQYEPPIANLTLFTPTRAAIIKPVLLISVCLLWIPILIAWTTVQRDGPIDGGLIAVVIGISCLILDFILYIWWLMARQRLITSPVGIEYVSPGSYSIRTSWNNLIKPGKAPFGVFSVGGVEVRRAALDMSTFYQGARQLQPWLPLLMALVGRHVSTPDVEKLTGSIPLNFFDGKWQIGETPLGATLRRNAPQVFGEPLPNRPVPAPDTFPPSLSPLTWRPQQWWRRIMIPGILLIQISLLVGIPWWWNGGFAVRTLATDLYNLDRVSFTIDGERLLVIGSDFQQWQLPEGKLVSQVDNLPSFSQAALSPDYTRIALGGWQSSASVWGITNGSGTLLRTLLPQREDSLAPSVSSIAFAPDNETIAIGLENGTLRLWSVRSGTVLKTLQDNGDLRKLQLALYSLDYREVQGLTFASDSSLLAFFDNESGVQMWRLPTNTPVVIRPETYSVSSLTFSPDSQMLAVGTDDGTIELYGVVDGSLVYTLERQRSSVSSLAFTLNGALLASGDDDGAIYLWRMRDKSHVKSLRIHKTRITTIAFSPDNRTLASGSDDDSVRLWDISDLGEAAQP